jgi:hypothetical protein
VTPCCFKQAASAVRLAANPPDVVVPPVAAAALEAELVLELDPHAAIVRHAATATSANAAFLSAP